MHSGTEFAGSHLQLMAQLRAAGVGEEGLGLVRDAYELAMQLFSGQYRCSGVPFLTHLVRTASIVVEQGEPPEVVAASLLHAAYAAGDFGFAERALSERKRELLRDALPAPVEALVARYAALPWSLEVLEGWTASADGVAGMDATERSVLLIRLCNELEDHLDLADLHSPRFREQIHASPSSLEHLGRMCECCRRLAHALGRPGLAEAFAGVWQEIATAEVAEACVVEPRLWVSARLQRPRGEDAAYRIAPASQRRRPVVWLRESLRDNPALRGLYRIVRRSN
jgi:hypothetical protein